MADEKHLHRIKNGTVVDHIPPGLGQHIFRFIQTTDDVVMLGVNFRSPARDSSPSEEDGRKDMLKYERDLSKQEEHLIAILTEQDCSIVIIANGQVVSKSPPEKPDVISSVLVCPNPICITNIENEETVFITSPEFRCIFCERIVKIKDLEIRYDGFLDH